MADEQAVQTPPVGIPLPEACTGMGSADVLAAGAPALTYRQLNYWTAAGLLGPVHMHPDRPGGLSVQVDRDEVYGSGYRMCYTAAQAAQAVWMAFVMSALKEDTEEVLSPRLAARLWHGPVYGDMAGHRFCMLAWEDRDGD